jgi:hypothetical protein
MILGITLYVRSGAADANVSTRLSGPGVDIDFATLEMYVFPRFLCPGISANPV